MKRIPYLLVLGMLLIAQPKQVHALGGAYQSHDPSTIIKDGSKYWMFTTGNGIYAAYSTNMYYWTSGPKTVFPIGTWPSWINTAVPGFSGTFWANERSQGVYPNPVIKGKPVSIVLGSPGKYITTNIFTSDGKLVYSNKQLASNKVQVPAPKRAGVYMIRVMSDEGVVTKRLVVE